MLIWAGAITLVLAIAAAVLTAFLFARVLPSGVLRFDGSAGPAVVGQVPAPGTAEVTLEGGESYDVFLATPGDGARLGGDLEVVAPDGSVVDVERAAVQSTVALGGVHAETVAGFEAPVDGDYTVRAPELLGAADGELLLTPATAFGGFMAGIAGSVFGVFVVLGLGVVGLGLLVGGIVWRTMRPRS